MTEILALYPWFLPLVAGLGGCALGCLSIYFMFVQRARRQNKTLQEDLSQVRHQMEKAQAERDFHLAQAERTQTRHDLILSEYEQKLAAQEGRVLQLSTAAARQEAELEQARKSLTQQAELLETAKSDLRKEFELTANRLFDAKSQQFTTANQSLLETTLSPFKTQLQDFRKKVEDVYDKENSQRNRLAGQIDALQKQAHKISEDAVNLAQALKGNSKTQGGWGEVILERLLEQSGLQKGREYETQLSVQTETGSRRMPDVVVHLPEGKDIVIDAKVSLTDYERYCNADNEAERQQYLQQHIQSLRNHIRGLSAKDYEKLPGLRVLDFVFIFVPIEAAFMLALQYEPGLYKEAYDKHIILASPTTLLAILRTVENIWRYEKQNRNAEKIAAEAGALHDQFVLMVESVESLGAQIDKTRDVYQTAHKRLVSGRGNLITRVENIRKLGAKTKRTLNSSLIEQAGEVSGQSDADEVPEADL